MLNNLIVFLNDSTSNEIISQTRNMKNVNGVIKSDEHILKKSKGLKITSVCANMWIQCEKKVYLKNTSRLLWSL